MARKKKIHDSNFGGARIGAGPPRRIKNAIRCTVYLTESVLQILDATTKSTGESYSSQIRRKFIVDETKEAA